MTLVAVSGINVKMRELKENKVVQAVAAALLKDGNRTLFLCTKNLGNGAEELCLPSATIYAGESAPAVLKQAVMESTGIDCEVGGIAFQSKTNAGSRKHRKLVPTLAFNCFAKSMHARPAGRYCGAKWITREEIRKHKISRQAQWVLEFV